MRIWIQVAKRVNITRVDEIFHPFALFRQESRRICIGLWIMDINSTMADIIIPTDNQIWLLDQKLITILLKIVQKAVFKFLPHIAGCTGREIGAHHRNLIEISTDDTTFKVIVFMTATIFDMCGRYLGEESDTTIPFFLCWIPVMFIAHLFQQYHFRYLIWRGLDLLKTHNIRIHALEPSQPVLL